METTVIRIEALTKHYSTPATAKPALDDINLHIKRGEIFGIIGRSGAGKSTLIRTLNLLERPSSGRILIEGEDITRYDDSGLAALRRRTGMIFQHFNLLNSKSVADNIAFPLKLAGNHDRTAIRRRVDELLELVGLGALRDSYPHRLSGGQKQRVGIARALSNSPSVLLSDEATSALDPETTQSILELLASINRQLGLTIVLITHEMQVIRSLCDRVAVIDGGRIAESGAVSDVFLHPRHAVTQSLLAETGGMAGADLAAVRLQATGPLLRLTFVGAATYQPVLSIATRETGIDFNILQGSIGRIKDTPYGQLLVEVMGTPGALPAVTAQLDRYQIHYEVVA
ncbi:methionine ABC transporter ATP-binding protein [Paludibacterium yongneupense]|uniref:methionine ABC transporter ATP-binding protein n=1 Tax=Paludibacterium yongneupense TaxID=400061 RepID=UPI0012EB08A7|nr:methionine ABC transporter ATP-binding protein [Paludibacterium yongneupense]